MRFKFFLIFLTAAAINLLNADTINQEKDLFNKDIPSFFINGTFLYWTIDVGSLDYAASMKNTAWGPDNIYSSGDYKLAKFDWDPGFRIDMGYYNATKYYKVFLDYSRIVISNSNSASKPDYANLFLTGTFPQIISEVSHANSHIKMNYDLINLLASRVFIPNPHLRLGLFGGLTTIIMKQKWHVKYYDSESNITDIKNKWSYFGGGLKLGLDLDWFWGNCLYFTAKSSTALYVGKYKNTSFQKTNFSLGPSYDTNIAFKDSKYDHYRPSFSVEFLLGPSWQKSFSQSRLELFAGYELNGWFNLHEIYRSSYGTQSSSKETYINKSFLAFHGLTTRMSVDF